MNYYYIVLVSIFSLSNVFSQSKSGFVEYKVVFGSDEILETLDKKMVEEFKNETEAEQYLLEFNEKEYVFYLKDKMTIDSKKSSKKTFYYKEKDSLYSIRPVEDDTFGKFMVKEQKNTNWELHNETKMIGEFLCYKATSYYIADRGAYGVFKFPIIAWYTPQIPLSYGPLTYGGLPGMILELQERNITYGATIIKFTSLGTTSRLAKPNRKDKMITLEEYHKMIQEYYKK